MKNDRFWKYFLATCGTLILTGAVLAYGTITFISPQNLPAIVLPGVNGGDPFVHAQTTEGTLPASDYFFRESIPLGYDKWSWGASVDWRTHSHYFEGLYALGITFTEAWGGIEISGPGISTRGFGGIALAVYAEAGMENVYIELYEKNGTLIGRQSIGWYFPEKKLKQGMWQEIIIPLQNFNGTSTPSVGRVSIIGKEMGKVYVDAIRLVATAPQIERWEPKSEETNVSVPTLSELMMQASPLPLPYHLEFTPVAAGAWYTTTGMFRFAPTEAQLGLFADGTDATALLLPGQSWSNYRVDTVVNWGTPDTFSLLVRFKDEKNYASCAFSTYGLYIQIYQVLEGESHLIAESPELSLPQTDTWKEARHGAEVVGDRVTCYLYGEKIITALLPTLPKQGTVGVEAWSSNPGGSPHRLQSLSISPL